jgi:predicted amidophosphoribosyltransferase
MALIQCEICGKQIATSAKTCPHCSAERQGTVVIHLRYQFVNRNVKVKVAVDGRSVGELY